MDRQRRDFITLVAGAAAVLPVAAWAQQPAVRVYRVGYVTIASRTQQLHLIEAFEESLRGLAVLKPGCALVCEAGMDLMQAAWLLDSR